MKEFDFDFKKYCKKCSWCCYGESPYVSEEELKKLRVKNINEEEGKPCKLLKNGMCSKYNDRPFDCRIFPLDIKNIDGKIMWVLWENCPAAPDLNTHKFIEYIEKELPKKYSFQHILNHIKYDKSNLADKYSKIKYKVLREVSWKT